LEELPTRLVGLEEGPDRFREADGRVDVFVARVGDPRFLPPGIDEIRVEPDRCFQSKIGALDLSLPVGEPRLIEGAARKVGETRDADPAGGAQEIGARQPRARKVVFVQGGQELEPPATQARAGRRRRKRRDRFAR
jgi:hypothetical protein